MESHSGSPFFSKFGMKALEDVAVHLTFWDAASTSTERVRRQSGLLSLRTEKGLGPEFYAKR
jgi:hypothetical protein